MIEYIGLYNMIYLIAAFTILIAWNTDRSLKRTLEHMDKLQERMRKLEKKGIITID